MIIFGVSLFFSHQIIFFEANKKPWNRCVLREINKSFFLIIWKKTKKQKVNTFIVRCLLLVRFNSFMHFFLRFIPKLLSVSLFYIIAVLLVSFLFSQFSFRFYFGPFGMYICQEFSHLFVYFNLLFQNILVFCCECVLFSFVVPTKSLYANDGKKSRRDKEKLW